MWKKSFESCSKVGIVAYEHPNGTYKICINQSFFGAFCQKACFLLEFQGDGPVFRSFEVSVWVLWKVRNNKP